MHTIGACEARTHLPRLLDRAQRGERLTITRHGRPVARLVPVEGDDRERARESAERLRALRARLHARGKTAPVGDLIATIHEGHRD